MFCSDNNYVECIMVDLFKKDICKHVKCWFQL